MVIIHAPSGAPVRGSGNPADPADEPVKPRRNGEQTMHDVHYAVGEIAKAPKLQPGKVWRRRISPTPGPWHFSVPLADYDVEFRACHPDEPNFATEVKTTLDDGDEFSAARVGGGSIKLTVGAPIPPGGNP